jgi:hypothetical protein
MLKKPMDPNFETTLHGLNASHDPAKVPKFRGANIQEKPLLLNALLGSFRFISIISPFNSLISPLNSLISLLNSVISPSQNSEIGHDAGSSFDQKLRTE